MNATAQTVVEDETVTVPGSYPSPWYTDEILYVGVDGTATLSILPGGAVFSGRGRVGWNPGSSGTVAVDGGQWQNGGAITLGLHGTGVLDIGNGGQVRTDANIYLGAEESGNGYINISGPNSLLESGFQWHPGNNVPMFVGMEGRGVINATGGARINSAGGILGWASGAHGEVFMDNSHWSSTHAIVVGASGSGLLQITNGSTVTSNQAYVGQHEGSSGEVQVSGTGSILDTGQFLWLGYEGQGKLSVLDGGQVQTVSVSIGNLPTGVGEVHVSGASLNAFGVLVGPQGSGTLRVTDGGLVSANDVIVAYSTRAKGTGNVEVSGNNSRLHVAQSFWVGSTGTGSLAISEGGTVSSSFVYLGDDEGGEGNALVTGAGSALTVDGTFTVGHEGDAKLVVSDDGIVRAGTLQLAEISGNADVAIRDGGVLEVGGNNGIRAGSGLYAFELSSATLRIAGSDLTTDVDVVLGSTSTIDTNSLNATWSGTLSGNGGLVKSGLGTLLLSNGGNAYQGGTRIERGGLEVHATGALGTGAVEIDEGFLVFDSSASAGDASISNNGGSLIVRNDGSLGSARILNSIGQWTDADGNVQQRYGFIQFQSETDPSTGLPVDNGRLARGGDAHVINEKGASISFANSGYLAENITIENRDDSSVSFNVSGDASGARVHNGPDATVHIIGFHNLGAGGLGRVPGTLELGSLDGSGKVMLGSNTLVLGGLGSDDHISGVISDSGEYLFNGFPTTANPEAAHGGHLVKTGPGTLTLTGENTYSGGTTVTAGTLLGNSLSLQGLIDVHGRLVFDQPFDGTFAGTLTGDGSFDKTGAYSLVFNGDGNGFQGATTIQAGTLLVGGDPSFSHVVIGGTVHVEAGATLGGHGTIGGLDANGTISPGSSLGVLTVQEDAYLRSGSTYLAETDTLGNSDRLHVGGTLTIDPGSTLQVLGSEGRWQPFTDYTLIQAADGVTGRFDDVYVNFAFLDAILDYAGNGIGLTLQRNTLDFASIALSNNQRGTAAAVEGLGWGDPLYDAVLMLDERTAVGALDQLAGGIHAASRGALRERSHDLRDAAWARGRRDAGFWAQAIGGWGAIAADGNAARLEQERIGLLLGVDRPTGEDGYIGVLIGYDDGELSSEAVASTSDVRTLHAGAYGGFRRGRFFVDAGAGYSRHRLDTRRHIAFDLFTDRLESRYDASTVQAFARGGMALTSVVDGFLDVAHVRVDTDDLREAGGPAAMHVEGDEDGSTYASIGMRLDLPVAQGTTRITGSMAWRHRLGGDDPAAAVAHFDGSGPFVVEAPATGRNSLVGQASASWRVGTNGRFSLAYAGIGGDARDQRLRATYSITF